VPDIPAVPDDVAYGSGRMDQSGRVADRAITSVLGWQAGDRLTLTAAAGVVIARRDPGGLVTMPSRPYLVIPAALRRRCGPVTGCCWPCSRRGTRWPGTRSRWWTRRCGRTPRSPARGAAMTAVHPGASRQAVAEAALVVLERMDLAPDDLPAVPQSRKPVPAFAEYVPVVSASVRAGTRRA